MVIVYFKIENMKIEYVYIVCKYLEDVKVIF